jgi:hypothetical protein
MSVDRGGQGPFGFGGTEASGKTVFLSGGTTLHCFDLDSNGGGFGSLSVSVGTWYRTAITVSGTNCSWYHGTTSGALTVASVANISSPTGGSQTWSIGTPSFSSEWWNGRLAALKIFDAQLTQAEVENELARYVPFRTANLVQWHPFVTAETVDYSGAGNTLSGGTGTTTESGPPVPWGPPRPQLILPASSASTSANAGAATGTGAAHGPSVLVATSGAHASSSGSGQNVTPGVAPAGVSGSGDAAVAAAGSVAATASHAVASGTAAAASAQVQASAGPAGVAGVAHDPAAAAGTETAPPAAAAAGAAHAPTGALTTNAGIVAAAVAHHAGVAAGPGAMPAAASGAAHAATVGHGATVAAGAAYGSGSAAEATALIVVTGAAAPGDGAALGATATTTRTRAHMAPMTRRGPQVVGVDRRLQLT